MSSASKTGVYPTHYKHCSCIFCKNAEINYKRDSGKAVKRNNSFHTYLDSMKMRGLGINVIDNTSVKLSEAKTRHNIIRMMRSTRDNNERDLQNETPSKHFGLNDNRTRTVNNDGQLSMGYKFVSFSEPTPIDIKKQKYRHTDPNCTTSVSSLTSTPTNPCWPESKDVPRKRSSEKTICNKNNEDIANYLKRFEEFRFVTFSTIPMAKKKSEINNFTHKHSNKYHTISTSNASPRNSNNSQMDEFNTIGIKMNDVCLNQPEFSTPQREPSVRFSTTRSSTRTSSSRDSIESGLLIPQTNDSASVWTDARCLSLDTSSCLSSETDSDFSYYPGSSILYDLSLPSVSPGYKNRICPLPSHLEDPDSPVPPFRTEYLETSLEDLTRHFYLDDDDALSDEVFSDDYQYQYNNNLINSQDYCWLGKQAGGSGSDRRLNQVWKTDFNVDRVTNPTRLVVSSKSYEMEIKNQIKSAEHNYSLFSGSCGDIDISGLCDNNSFTSQRHDSSSNVRSADTRECGENVSRNNSESLVFNTEVTDVGVSPSSEFDDSELLGYNLTLANAFDSLRRNSMQTKSRKLWKERRARMKRSNLFHGEATISTTDVVISLDSTTAKSKTLKENKTDHNLQQNDKEIVKSSSNLNVKQSPIKPLRGILKNKNVLYQNNLDTSENALCDQPSSKPSPHLSTHEESPVDPGLDLTKRSLHLRGESLNFTFPLDERCKFNYHKMNNMANRKTEKENGKLCHGKTPSPTFVSIGVQVDLQNHLH